MANGGTVGVRRELGIVLLLGLLVALGFGVAVRGDFVWDDRPLIVENALIQDPSHLGTLLTSGFWETGDRHDRFRAFFRPVVSLTYAIDYALWGPSPEGFHVSNLLLHWLCCWLVYRILADEGLGLAAVAGAAVFAVHPVHVENVAWISGRTDLVCATLMLGAFAVYRRRLQRSRSGPSVLALGLFGLSLFAKEMAATLPFLIALDAWLVESRDADASSALRRLRVTAARVAPFLIVLAGYVFTRRLLLGPGGAPLFMLDAAEFVATALFVLGRYVTLLLLPLGLDAHHPDPPLSSPLDGLAIVSALILGVLSFAAFRLRRRCPAISFWILWVPVALLPVLTFGRFGDVILADRFLYIPSVGLAGVVAWAWAGAWASWGEGAAGKLPRRIALVAAGLVIAGLVGASWQRCLVWRDDLTLFSDMARTSPHSALVTCNLGLVHYRRGELDLAIDEFQKALTAEPRYATAHNSLAAAYESKGQQSAALRHYSASLELAPQQLDAGVNLGHLLTRMGRPAEGLTRLRDAVGRYPRSARAQYHLGEALERTGDPGAALPHLEAARRLDPDFANPHYLLGKIYSNLGRRAEAEVALQRFLELWPEDDLWAKSARTLLRSDRS